jgi:hypothetical protein
MVVPAAGGVHACSDLELAMVTESDGSWGYLTTTLQRCDLRHEVQTAHADSTGIHYMS